MILDLKAPATARTAPERGRLVGVDMAERTCTQCSESLTGRQKLYCSPLCRSRGFTAARIADGRLREYRKTRQHHDSEYRKRRTTGLTGLPIANCAACGMPTGKVAASEPGRRRVCSSMCRSYLRVGAWPSSRVPARIVPRPRRAAVTTMDQRTPLRRAWESEDWPTVQAELLRHTERHLNGCQVWTGCTRDGYSVVKIGRKRLSAYRVMAMATNGAAIGPSPVHHTCANRACIAPAHLQIVTPIANIAEMLHRNWYIERIDVLEAALAQLDPNHPALTTLPFAV